MAQQTINVGAAPNDGTGTPLRTAFQYTNSNFTELYTAVGPSGNNIVVPGTATITGDLTVRTNKLAVTSSGVGFGTTTPAYPAHFRTTSPVIAIQDDTSAATGVGGVMNFLGFTSGTSGANIFAQIKGVKTAGSAGGEYQVFTSDSAGNSIQRYLIDSTGISTWSVAGTTAMTLNSNGLGIGAGPSYKFHVQQTLAGTASAVNPIAYIVNNGSGNTAKLTLSDSVTTDGNITLTGSATAANRLLGFGINGVQQMVLDGSGNVGIGVTPSLWSASYKVLDIAGGGGITSLSNGLYLASNGYENGGWKKKGAGYANLLLNVSGEYRFNTSTLGAGAAGDAITFTQAMTLDASGNLLVGKTSASVTTVGFQTLPSGEASVAMAATTGAATTLNVYSTGAAAYRFFVGLNGTISATNTTISAISDARFKENVQDIDVGLGAILALKPRKFDWKAGKGKDIKGDRGFIAQEFETVFPQLVDEWKDPAPEGEAPYKSVRQDLIPVLVKAIQELTARVQTLEAK